MSDDAVQKLLERVDALRETVAKLTTEVATLRVQIELRKECPSPGMCIELGQQLKEHEILIQQVKGAIRLSLILTTLFGATLGAILTKLLTGKSS